MLNQSRNEVAASLHAKGLRIREKELHLFHDSLTESGLGLGGAIIAEIAFEALIELGFDGSDDWEGFPGCRMAFILLMALTLCIAVNCTVICGSAVVFGPGLGMRGESSTDLIRALEGMEKERNRAAFGVTLALLSLEAGVLPLLWNSTHLSTWCLA